MQQNDKGRGGSIIKPRVERALGETPEKGALKPGKEPPTNTEEMGVTPAPAKAICPVSSLSPTTDATTQAPTPRARPGSLLFTSPTPSTGSRGEITSLFRFSAPSSAGGAQRRSAEPIPEIGSRTAPVEGGGTPLPPRESRPPPGINPLPLPFPEDVWSP